MKALVYHGPRDLKIADYPDVFPKAGEVRLRVRACGICGSDVHGYLGITGRRLPPMVMGHEFAGEIAALGPGMDMLAVGDRVAVYPVEFCGNCAMCEKGDVHLCQHKRAYGVLDVDGAFAEYICVPAKTCFPLADTLSYAVGSLMEPLAVAHRGVGHAGSLRDKNVLIVGAGTIGLLALACAKMQKPRSVTVSDLNDSRLAVARKMGADHALNPSKGDLGEAIASVTKGKGMDIAIEAVGAAATVRQALAALAFGGTAVWIGNSQRLIEIDMQEVVTRELKVFGSFLYGFAEFGEVVRLLGEGRIDASPLISLEIPPEKAAEYFDKLADDPGDLIKVVVAGAWPE